MCPRLLTGNNSLTPCSTASSIACRNVTSASLRTRGRLSRWRGSAERAERTLASPFERCADAGRVHDRRGVRCGAHRDVRRRPGRARDALRNRARTGTARRAGARAARRSAPAAPSERRSPVVPPRPLDREVSASASSSPTAPPTKNPSSTATSTRCTNSATSASCNSAVSPHPTTRERTALQTPATLSCAKPPRPAQLHPTCPPTRPLAGRLAPAGRKRDGFGARQERRILYWDSKLTVKM